LQKCIFVISSLVLRHGTKPGGYFSTGGQVA
jgi:hypothetical protein